MLQIFVLFALGASVGIHWGPLPAVAAVSATYLLMPYRYSR